jgi:hypothetical protein
MTAAPQTGGRGRSWRYPVVHTRTWLGEESWQETFSRRWRASRRIPCRSCGQRGCRVTGGAAHRVSSHVRSERVGIRWSAWLPTPRQRQERSRPPRTEPTTADPPRRRSRGMSSGRGRVLTTHRLRSPFLDDADGRGVGGAEHRTIAWLASGGFVTCRGDRRGPPFPCGAAPAGHRG